MPSALSQTMTPRHLALSALLISTLAALCATARAAGLLPFKTIADIALTGNATRLDYQTLDPSRNLLFSRPAYAFGVFPFRECWGSATLTGR